MGYEGENNAESLVNAYIGKEIAEYRKISEKELNGKSITPEARAAFSRKPYYASAGISLKSRPVLR